MAEQVAKAQAMQTGETAAPDQLIAVKVGLAALTARVQSGESAAVSIPPSEPTMSPEYHLYTPATCTSA